MATSASGRSLRGRANEAPERRQRARNLGDGFGEPGDRQFPIVVEQPAAGRRNLRTAEAGDGNAGIERPELADQRTRVQVAGGFAARQEEPNTQEVGRLKSDGSTGTLSFTLLDRRSTLWVPI